MRCTSFLARILLLALAIVLVGIGGTAAYARCRCGKACRVEARQARKAARCGNWVQPGYAPSHGSDGAFQYGDSVQPLGISAPQPATVWRKTNAEAPAGYHWECNGQRCKLVRDVVPAPVPDPAFKQVQPPKTETPSPATKVSLPDPVPPVKSPPLLKIGLR